MISIDIKDDEVLEKAINRFKRNVSKEGIITEVRKRQYFVKPSALKHERNKKLKRKIARKKLKAVKNFKEDK